MLTEPRPVAVCLSIFSAIVIVVFPLYLRIALRAVLHATDQDQQQVRYQVFRDPFDLFHRGKRQ